MSDLQALLGNVLLHPHDDGPRLVYADALQEAGDVRGELISLECQLARILEDERGPQELELAAREQQLLNEHAKRWLGDWPFELLPQFSRGFPEHQHALTRDFVRLLPTLDAPLLRSFTLLDQDPGQWPQQFAAFMRLREVETLEHLTLPITFRALDAELLSNGAARALRSLCFKGGSLDDGGARLLALGLPQLRKLVFEFDAGVRDNGFKAFSRFPLTTFINRRNAMSPLTVQWPTLQRLTVDRVELGRAGAALPAMLPALTHLELYDTGLGRRGAFDLFARGHPTVRRLGLRLERVDAAVFELLGRWPALEALELSSCELDLAAVHALAASPIAHRLKCLWLRDNPLERADLTEALKAFPSLQVAGL